MELMQEDIILMSTPKNEKNTRIFNNNIKSHFGFAPLPSFPNSSSQDTISNATPSSKQNPSKISQPTNKKLKRNKSIDKIVLKIDEMLEPIINPDLMKYQTKKISFEQF